MDERLATNQRRWDEMAALHETNYFRDGVVVDGELKRFEIAELGDLTGQRVCHLQCHLGGESLALGRLGAGVVGVDFSTTALEIATRRAADAGMSDRVRFVAATVDEAPEAAGSGFDGVYTSWGVLCWLPDLDAWATSVAALLRVGGWLYLAEMHPYATTLRWNRPYGGAVALHDDDHGDYTDENARFDNPESWEWTHGLGEIVSSIVRAGLRLEHLHEWSVTPWNLGDATLTRRDDGMWEAPGSTLPLSFTLRATKT